MAKITLFDSIVREYIGPQLKAAGFRKSKSTWNRTADSLVHVIDAQESRWSGSDETAFTLNIGVMVRPVERILWGKEPPKVVPGSACFPRFRIGYLPGVEHGQDLWWKLRSVAEVEHVGAEVVDLIHAKCLPLLDDCQSIPDALELADGVDQWKQPAEKLALAVLMCLAGQKDAGQAMLDDLEADPKLKGWHPRISGTRTRLPSYMAH